MKVVVAPFSVGELGQFTTLWMECPCRQSLGEHSVLVATTETANGAAVEMLKRKCANLNEVFAEWWRKAKEEPE